MGLCANVQVVQVSLKSRQVARPTFQIRLASLLLFTEHKRLASLCYADITTILQPWFAVKLKRNRCIRGHVNLNRSSLSQSNCCACACGNGAELKRARNDTYFKNAVVQFGLLVLKNGNVSVTTASKKKSPNLIVILSTPRISATAIKWYI